ncbi:YybS family protein [Peribacillus sp. SCS-155]|uniref:YybS family protein n=1 Tax=Peribacillus sedimenti TaxID=3115297 RepID=UPI0039065BEA
MNNRRKITEGAVLLALFSIMLLMAFYLPFLGAILFFFLPVPFILISSKYEASWSFGFLFIALILSAILSTVFSLPMTLITGLTGITIGYMLRKEKPAVTVFMSSFLVLLAGIIAVYGLSIWLFQMNFIEQAIEMFKKSVAQAADFAAALGQAADDKVIKQLLEAADMIEVLLPSILVLTSAFMLFLFLLAAHPFVKRFSDKKIAWPRFKDIQLPKSLLWYYLITMLATYMLMPEKSSFLYMVIGNLLAILQVLMLLQGYSLIFFLSHIKKWPRGVPIAILVITLILPSPLFQSIIRILGIVDLGFPLRTHLEKGSNQS